MGTSGRIDPTKDLPGQEEADGEITAEDEIVAAGLGLTMGGADGAGAGADGNVHSDKPLHDDTPLLAEPRTDTGLMLRNATTATGEKLGPLDTALMEMEQRRRAATGVNSCLIHSVHTNVTAKLTRSSFLFHPTSAPSGSRRPKHRTTSAKGRRPRTTVTGGHATNGRRPRTGRKPSRRPSVEADAPLRHPPGTELCALLTHSPGAPHLRSC